MSFPPKSTKLAVLGLAQREMETNMDQLTRSAIKRAGADAMILEVLKFTMPKATEDEKTAVLLRLSDNYPALESILLAGAERVMDLSISISKPKVKPLGDRPTTEA